MEYTDINLQALRQWMRDSKSAHHQCDAEKINHTSSGKQRKLSSIISTLAIGILPEIRSSHEIMSSLILRAVQLKKKSRLDKSTNPACWKHPNEKPFLLGISPSLWFV
jgi:hypothetical protein